MSESTKLVKKRTLKSLFAEESIVERFQSMLGSRAQSFITTVLQVSSQNDLLKKADPVTIMNAAATAAALDLSINPNLGHAYIIPYNVSYKDDNNQWQKKTVAQFQMGYKGFIQLAQRTNQYKSIIGIAVYENQFKSWDPLTETLDADFMTEGEGEIVGYVGGFALLNGFSKIIFWTHDKVHKHAFKYSKSYDKKSSVWKDEGFGSVEMAIKTVLKRALSKFGPIQIESPLHNAINADQSVQYSPGSYTYIDNPATKVLDINGNTAVAPKNEEILELINSATSPEELDGILETHKAAIGREIILATELGKARKRLEDE